MNIELYFFYHENLYKAFKVQNVIDMIERLNQIVPNWTHIITEEGELFRKKGLDEMFLIKNLLLDISKVNRFLIMYDKSKFIPPQNCDLRESLMFKNEFTKSLFSRKNNSKNSEIYDYLQEAYKVENQQIIKYFLENMYLKQGKLNLDKLDYFKELQQKKYSEESLVKILNSNYNDYKYLIENNDDISDMIKNLFDYEELFELSKNNISDKKEDMNNYIKKLDSHYFKFYKFNQFRIAEDNSSMHQERENKNKINKLNVNDNQNVKAYFYSISNEELKEIEKIYQSIELRNENYNKNEKKADFNRLREVYIKNKEFFEYICELINESITLSTSLDKVNNDLNSQLKSVNIFSNLKKNCKDILQEIERRKRFDIKFEGLRDCLLNNVLSMENEKRKFFQNAYLLQTPEENKILHKIFESKNISEKSIEQLKINMIESENYIVDYFYKKEYENNNNTFIATGITRGGSNEIIDNNNFLTNNPNYLNVIKKVEAYENYFNEFQSKLKEINIELENLHINNKLCGENKSKTYIKENNNKNRIENLSEIVDNVFDYSQLQEKFNQLFNHINIIKARSSKLKQYDLYLSNEFSFEICKERKLNFIVNKNEEFIFNKEERYVENTAIRKNYKSIISYINKLNQIYCFNQRLFSVDPSDPDYMDSFEELLNSFVSSYSKFKSFYDNINKL